MSSSALSQAHLSQLVVIDVQTRLVAVMPETQLKTMLNACALLLQAARLLEVPALCSEQYPRGLGPTVPMLHELLGAAPRIEKTAFSCTAAPTFCRQLHSDRPQVVLAGMEAHICVLQTAMGLQALGKQVFVAEDAVISRDPRHHANALGRLREAGVIVSNSESIVFEWLGKAEGDVFKQISKLLR